ncbi:trna processing endoribonuclease trz1 [Trichoderma arundinaceum]|uniref:Trna processing endoribonuclease trz1 n=1 Tax=Trichoderma arundinaceum TaxID=490622 RepID=A0A395NWX0_TRIAR|nr:trna processing endoribonuclease trz1 [Trichoderma arundinaceum]
MEPTNKGPKACTTCAKAKARCIPGPDKDSKCERCQRLKKECVSQRPAPPRAKKAPKRSRVAELEKRLDELSSQFVDGAVAAAAATADPRSRQSTSISTPSTNHLSVTERPGQRQQRRKKTKCDSIVTFEYLFPSPRSESAEGSGWSSEAGSNDCVTAEGLWPTPAEAENLLVLAVSAETVSVEGSHDGQLLLGWTETASAGQGDIGRTGEDGGDGWKQVPWDVARATADDRLLTNLLFLARSMSVNSSSPGICGGGNREDVKWGELEHIRAYLGAYYLNAIVFNTNKKADAFMNTSQLDSYCNILTSAGEYPSDAYLVKLIKIQMLSQSISMAMTFDPAQQRPMQLPLTMVVQTFQNQIDSYRASLPPDLADNGKYCPCSLLFPFALMRNLHTSYISRTLQCHLAISEILLADISISDPHCSAVALSLNDRIHLLWSCLRGLRRFYTVHGTIKCCSISDTERRHFLGLNASDLAYSIITGIKLLLVRLPGWDPQYIVSELGVREMLDEEVRDVGEIVARRENGRWTEEDPLGRMHKLLKYGRDLVDFQLQKLKMEVEAGGSSGESVSLSPPVVVNKGEGAQAWMMMGMEDLDDDLWQSFMNDTALGLSGEPMVMDAF